MFVSGLRTCGEHCWVVDEIATTIIIYLLYMHRDAANMWQALNRTGRTDMTV